MGASASRSSWRWGKRPCSGATLCRHATTPGICSNSDGMTPEARLANGLAFNKFSSRLALAGRAARSGG